MNDKSFYKLHIKGRVTKGKIIDCQHKNIFLYMKYNATINEGHTKKAILITCNT